MMKTVRDSVKSWVLKEDFVNHQAANTAIALNLFIQKTVRFN
jgi:hypothetical protein